MKMGGTKPERLLISFEMIEPIQVWRTAAPLVNPVTGCLPGGLL